jgi:hypothetical protein
VGTIASVTTELTQTPPASGTPPALFTKGAPVSSSVPFYECDANSANDIRVQSSKLSYDQGAGPEDRRSRVALTKGPPCK